MKGTNNVDSKCGQAKNVKSCKKSASRRSNPAGKRTSSLTEQRELQQHIQLQKVELHKIKRKRTGTTRHRHRQCVPCPVPLDYSIGTRGRRDGHKVGVGSTVNNGPRFGILRRFVV